MCADVYSVYSYCFELLDTSIYVSIFGGGVKQTAYSAHPCAFGGTFAWAPFHTHIGVCECVRASLLVQNALHINKLERKIVFQFILCDVENIFCANLACFSLKLIAIKTETNQMDFSSNFTALSTHAFTHTHIVYISWKLWRNEWEAIRQSSVDVSFYILDAMRMLWGCARCLCLRLNFKR